MFAGHNQHNQKSGLYMFTGRLFIVPYDLVLIEVRMALAWLRKANFCTLPVEVLGMSVKAKCLGTLKRAKCSRQ